jgi:asparagine synthase (glutamine-hydrolysing)
MAWDEGSFGMGAVIAVVNKRGGSVTETAVAMLKMLEHSGVEAFGIASPTITKIEKSVDLLRHEDINSPTLIGHVFSRTLMSDKPQPTKLENTTLVFDGRIYPPNTEFSDAEFAAEKLEQNRQENIEALIKNFEGSFAFAVAESDRLIAGRDSLGAYPFYYGENAYFAALASERKALWKIGIKEANSFPSGHIAVVDKHGFKFTLARTLVLTRTGQTTMQAAAKELRRLLHQSVKERVAGLKEVAVAFSGGLDSGIIAFLARNFGTDVHLIFVSLEGQTEAKYAKEAAEALKLPLHVYCYSEEAVEEVLPKVLWLIEETNPVKTSIGIPVFWAAEKASEMGFKVMLAGQGADELFGGYKRYLNDYSQYGKESVQKKIFNDTARMYEVNLERDSKICNFHNIELRLPFAAYQLAKFAVSLPLQLKIESPDDMLRKIVLRKVAEDMGLPHFIANKPKRAIQYATGVNRVVKRLAKQRGLAPREYLQEKFQTIFERRI